MPINMEDLEKDRVWLKKQNLNNNPFTLGINPSLFVGYEKQILTLSRNLDQQQKILLLIGPTGSGKTSIISYLSSKNKNHIFLSKPPKLEELVDIYPYFLNEVGFFEKIFLKKPRKTQDLAPFLNKIIKKHKILFIDEAHEANIEVLEWLRVLSDQVQNLTIVFSSLPIFDDILTNKLETLKKRITEKIELNALSREETEELIQKRIEFNGGEGIKPFTKNAIDYIYSRTGGFPRDILVTCNKLLNLGMEKDVEIIDSDIIENMNFEKKEPNAKFRELPNKQKKIIDILLEKEPRSTTELVNCLQYPSEEKGLRAVNNLLNRLLKENYIEREKFGKSYTYKLTPSIRTMLIKS